MKSLLPRYSHQADYESIDDGEDLSSRRTKEHSEGRSQGNILERTFRIDDAISKGFQLKFMEVEGKTNIEEEKWSSKRGFAWLGIVASSLLFVLVFSSLALDTRTRLSAVLLKTQPYKVVAHPEPPTSLWGTCSKPYPTGAFWTNLAVKNGDGPVALHPYGVKCLETGVHVSYGPTRRAVTQLSILDSFATDLQINSLEGYTSRSVERYDNGSVTMVFTTSSSSGLGKYRAILVKGSPFVTVAFDNVTPIISSPLMRITAVDQRPAANINSQGVQYLVTLGNFQRWLVHCSDPSCTLVWKENTLTSPNIIHGVIRIAILPQLNYEPAFSTLMTYVGCYPTGVQTSLSYTTSSAPADRSATLTLAFEHAGDCVGGNTLLMYALPHHTKSFLPNPTSNAFLDSEDSKAAQASLQPIYTIKGKLRAVVGDTWVLKYSLPQVGWNYAVAEKLATQQLDQIAQQLIQDIKSTASIGPTPSDPYSAGKYLGRIARLALIADYLGIPDSRSQAVSLLENAINPWIAGSNSDAILYDRVWGGLVPTNGIADPQADFGSGWYSDHHFHYGYFIYAAAVLAKLDASFYEANKGAFDAFVRDVCNPDSADADFPFARHKDLFDGHSWASGLFQQANGKGQESSSESTNAYYGCYLFALATGNKDLQYFSHFLLTTEIQAAQMYWHMPNDEIYDSIFASNRMVGNVGAFDVTASTWFGSELEYVHGINIMPVTPVTALLLDLPFVSVQYPLLASRLPPPTLPENQLCSANSECVVLGLSSGNCCPSPDGVSLACCSADGTSNSNSNMQEEWKSLIYLDHAVVDKEAARIQILSAGGFGIGNSKTNSLFWATTRLAPPTPIDLTPHPPDYDHSVKSSCAANSACDNAGKLNVVYCLSKFSR